MRISNTLLAMLFTSSALAGDPTYCRGNKAIYTPKATVRVKYPSTKNLPLDQAGRIKTDRLDLIRKYLKKSYFSGYMWDASREEEAAFRESVGHGGYTQQIADLMRDYTFRFPLKMVKTLFHEPREEGQIHYGYRYEDGDRSWSPELALSGADWMWNNYLWRETFIQEVASDSGDIIFQISLSLQLFCQVGVARSDLLSK